MIYRTLICAMAGTAGLTDHEIGTNEAGFKLVGKVFDLFVNPSLIAKLTTLDR